MRKMMVRVIAIALELAAIGTYNHITVQREVADQAAYEEYKAAYEAYQAAIAASAADEDGGYRDGTYKGLGFGFGGDIEVAVDIENGVISDISIVSADYEDAAYLDMAQEVISDMIFSQSTEVDTVSGATFSSAGLIEAAAAALEKAN